MNHFISLSKLQVTEAIKGGFLGSLQTENLTVAYTDMKAGVEIPLHHHSEEAIDIYSKENWKCRSAMPGAF